MNALGEAIEPDLNLDLLWLAYLSGQFGKETLEWHKRNTPGFGQHVTDKLSAILGEEAWAEDETQNG